MCLPECMCVPECVHMYLLHNLVGLCAGMRDTIILLSQRQIVWAWKGMEVFLSLSQKILLKTLI